MLCAFGRPVVTRCDVLGVVGSNFTIFKLEPNAHDMLHPTLLRYVALACCDRLAGLYSILRHFLQRKKLMFLIRFFSALSTIGFGDMVPRQGREPSSGIQTLELVIRSLYIVVGLALVSSLLSAVVSAAEVFDRWNICRRTKCM